MSLTAPQYVFKHEGFEYWVYADKVVDSTTGGIINGVIACSGCRRSDPPVDIVGAAGKSPFLVGAASIEEATRSVEDAIKTGRITTNR